MYLMQEIEAHKIIKKNQEGFMECFIDETYSTPPGKSCQTNKIVYAHIDETWHINVADFSNHDISNKIGFGYLFVITVSF